MTHGSADLKTPQGEEELGEQGDDFSRGESESENLL